MTCWGRDEGKSVILTLFLSILSFGNICSAAVSTFLKISTNCPYLRSYVHKIGNRLTFCVCADYRTVYGDNNDMAGLTYLVIFFAINVNGCYFQFTEPGLCPSEVMVIWQYLNTVHS